MILMTNQHGNNNIFYCDNVNSTCNTYVNKMIVDIVLAIVFVVGYIMWLRLINNA